MRTLVEFDSRRKEEGTQGWRREAGERERECATENMLEGTAQTSPSSKFWQKARKVNRSLAVR